MNRLEKKIQRLRKAGKKALIAYITAGYPDFASTERIFNDIVEAGADIVELGIPFSDPIADGQTIQNASYRSLVKGANIDKIFELTGRIRKHSDTPIILMGYLNTLTREGIERTAERAARAGVDGFIIPDVIPEESADVARAFKKHGLSLIFLAPPNVTNARLKFIDSRSSAFVYIVSLTGVTGGRKELPVNVRTFLRRTEKYIRKPRFVGFGISNPAQVKSLKNYADGVIVGSALLDIISGNKNAKTLKRKITRFVKSLKNALN